VYFRVEAANDLPATTLSPVGSYSLGFPVTVHEIQGEATVSPYDGTAVTTHGVVTATFGAFYVIQDGEGPWTGLWAQGSAVPAPGDSVTVTGRITENAGAGFAGTTMLVEARVMSSTPGAALPDALPVSTAGISAEANEGVLVTAIDADCTATDAGGGEWQVDDGSGAGRVGVLGYRASPILGTTYTVAGPVAEGAAFRIEPRTAADVAWTGDDAPPVVVRVMPLGGTTLRVLFSEAVEPLSAVAAGHYAIPGLVVNTAALEPGSPDRIRLAVSAMATGDYVLTVTGVADLHGNFTPGTAAPFSYVDPGTPAGYYDPALGLSGDALRDALHGIIDGHTARSYDYAWTAYTTTDVRPDNGKVWDIYSDIPGGIPPYLYDFGVDQGGVGGQEGTGYTREHTWCKNWFGGEVSPMYTDLFALYPCDTHMNGTRGVYPYAETAAPQWVSLNGSRVGGSSVPGYTGTVFEPRDDFKGDLARVYFYFSTRYHTEDAGWPGGPATDGADIEPWALALYLRWNDEDPVSRKEIDRNNAVYAIQGNRNPFVDRPEFVDQVFRPAPTGVEEAAPRAGLGLLPATPNPFTRSTRIAFEVGSPSRVTLRVYDLAGRVVRTLVEDERDAGRHEALWDGRDGSGREQSAGIYVFRLQAGAATRSGKLVRLR
jgi:endonuclease I